MAHLVWYDKRVLFECKREESERGQDRDGEGRSERVLVAREEASSPRLNGSNLAGRAVRLGSLDTALEILVQSVESTAVEIPR